MSGYPPHDPRPPWMEPYPTPEEEERYRRELEELAAEFSVSEEAAQLAREMLAAVPKECPVCGRLIDAPPEGCPGCGDPDG